MGTYAKSVKLYPVPDHDLGRKTAVPRGNVRRSKPSECEREMAGYPCLLSPFEHGLKYRPGILRLRPDSLLVGRHEPPGLQLPTPRLFAPRLETAVALPILERRRQPIRRQRWVGRVLANPTEHLGKCPRGLGTPWWRR